MAVTVKTKKRLFILIIALAAVTLLSGGCLIWASDYYRADMAEIERLTSSYSVKAEQCDGYLAFVPQDPTAGFIFYPGGKVEFSAYTPLMSALAQEGVLCILVKMPLNLAVLDVNAAEGLTDTYPQVEHWYIGGHSLGGSMAATHLENSALDYAGLILLASYSTADLSDNEIAVLSLYGSQDGVLNSEKYDKYLKNLPSTFTETVLDGGNHAYFGSYGEQSGDGIATISPDLQLALTAEAIISFIKE